MMNSVVARFEALTNTECPIKECNEMCAALITSEDYKGRQFMFVVVCENPSETAKLEKTGYEADTGFEILVSFRDQSKTHFIGIVDFKDQRRQSTVRSDMEKKFKNPSKVDLYKLHSPLTFLELVFEDKDTNAFKPEFTRFRPFVHDRKSHQRLLQPHAKGIKYDGRSDAIPQQRRTSLLPAEQGAISEDVLTGEPEAEKSRLPDISLKLASFKHEIIQKVAKFKDELDSMTQLVVEFTQEASEVVANAQAADAELLEVLRKRARRSY